MPRNKNLSEALTHVNKAIGIMQDLKATDLKMSGGASASDEALNSLRSLLEKSKITIMNLLR